MSFFQLWVAVLLLAINSLLLLLLFLRKPADADTSAGRSELLTAIAMGHDKLERELRREIEGNSRASRQELGTTFATFQQTLVQQSAAAIRTQSMQIDAFSQQLTLLQKTLSDTLVT